MSYKVTTYAVVILAAGRSSRLGRPKQLLAYRDKTLLQHSIDNAAQINAETVIVVLGSNKELIEDQIDTKGIQIIGNLNWDSGIASSIICGIDHLNSISPEIDALILMVCDQPYADSHILNNLLTEQKETGKAIIACAYDGIAGTPALFHRTLFQELLSLEGDTGAKKLFEKYKSLASFIPFKTGGIDIDTTEDYKNLSK